MLRKTTAVLFMVVMTLLITLKHPVLGYCLCLDAYFTGDCVCQNEKLSTPIVSEKPKSSCTSCCAAEASETPQEPAPCDDCTEHLNVEVGDFVWQSSDEVPAASESLLPSPAAFARDEAQFSIVSAYTPMSIRGDPPLGLSESDVPLYLRHSVLRL